MAETDCDQCAHGKLLSSRGVACCWFPGDPKEGGCTHFVDGVNASYQADLARQRLEELRQQQREDKAALAALEALQEQHNALIRVVDTMAGVIWWSQTAEMAPKHSAEQFREAWMHLREVAAKHDERWENQVMGHPGPKEGEE